MIVLGFFNVKKNIFQNVIIRTNMGYTLNATFEFN